MQLLQSRGEECVSGPSCFPLPQVKQGSFSHSFRPRKSWLTWLQVLCLEAMKKLGSGACPALFNQIECPEQTTTSLAPTLLYHQHLHGQTQMKSWPPKLAQLAVDPSQHCSCCLRVRNSLQLCHPTPPPATAHHRGSGLAPQSFAPPRGQVLSNPQSDALGGESYIPA